MANVRVYELAKELKISNHDLMSALAELGVEVKSHSSSLDDGTVQTLRQKLAANGGATVAAPVAPDGAATGGAAVADQKPKAPRKPEPAPAKKPEVIVPPQVTVRQLAEVLGIATSDVQKALVKQGALVAVNQVIAPDLAMKVTVSLGYSVAPQKPAPAVKAPKPAAKVAPVKVERVEVPTPEPQAQQVPKAPKAAPKREAVLVPRPPIVTILGHVDHGKTTLLDAIRKTNVTDQEFGGITQHIGAYQVDVKGKKITFLDTPGHAAFTAMRARGAQVTDIVILVVAADDGVMPQTIEALNHAKAAGVQIIAAINKIDKVDANVDRTKQQLAEHGLVIEEWGGDTVSVGVSAKTQKNLDDLLDMILLVAELSELKADATGPVEATVVEAQLDRGKGPVATVLVQSGTLKTGDTVVVGQAYGRVKAMMDDHGQRLQAAGPATPVELVGLSSVPLAGDRLEVVKNEREARQLAESRLDEKRTVRLSATQRVTLADLFKQLKEGTVKELNIVLKSDVQGSAEAICESLEQLSTEEVRVNLIHSGIGPIGESDVLLASASNAIVVGFNVRIDPQAKRTAESEHVDIRTYNIIYELLDEVKAGMEGLLEPVLEEQILGHAEVRATFRLPRGGAIAGCYVTDGKAQRNAEARIKRNNQVVLTGKVFSLKHIKDDVREMAAGFECGIQVEGYTDIQIGDIIEMFTITEIARRI